MANPDPAAGRIAEASNCYLGQIPQLLFLPALSTEDQERSATVFPTSDGPGRLRHRGPTKMLPVHGRPIGDEEPAQVVWNIHHDYPQKNQMFDRSAMLRL